MDAIITALPQLGIAGAAILVMYLMYKDSSARFEAKDKLMVAEVEKHQATQNEHQKYMREVHSQTMIQLSNASKVIEDNVKAYERVINILDKK